jgi:hypothetical protein
MKSEIALFATFICLGLSSCSSVKNETVDDGSAKPPPGGPSLVGRIASVPPDKHFVLVQRYGKWEGKTGQILTTRGPQNRTANLRTSGEKLGEFAAADIQSGSVGLGDAVYLQHLPKPAEPASSVPEPALPAEITDELPTAAAAAENVQKNN